MTSKNHSPPEHFRLELSCVLPPIGRLPNAESSFVTLSFERVVGRQRTTHALVHHGEAVVRECLIIHRGLFRQGTEAPRVGEKYLKKVPQPGEFNDLLRRQDSGDQFTLWSGVNLVQMQLRHWLGRELPYALVKSALGNGVGSGQRASLIIERGPFPENGRSIKIDLSVSVSHCFSPLV